MATRNLEQILAQAAAQPELRELLLGDREAAARDLGLSGSERQVLLAVPETQLTAVLDFLAVQGGEAPSAPPTAATGARPDVPPPVQGIRPDSHTLGIRPDVVSHGVRPVPGPVKGIRPGRVLLTAAAAATVGAGVAAFSISAGVRPDVSPPPVIEAAERDAGRWPDAGPPQEPREETPKK
jgi:hypothetical protein